MLNERNLHVVLTSCILKVPSDVYRKTPKIINIYIYIYIYISLIENVRSSHLSPWFSAACAAAIIHRNHFFCLYQNDKSSDSKLKFSQASNCCKRNLEAAKLPYANKTKESITSQKLGSQDFWRIANSVLNKGKSDIPPLSSSPEVLRSASKATVS